MNNIYKSSILSFDKVCLIEKLNNSFQNIYFGGSIALTACGILNRQIHDIDIIAHESDFDYICQKLEPFKKKKSEQNNKKELVTSPEKEEPNNVSELFNGPKKLDGIDAILFNLDLKKTKFKNSLKQKYYLKFAQTLDINLLTLSIEKYNLTPITPEDNYYSKKFVINNIDVCLFKSIIPIDYKIFDFYDTKIKIQTPEKIIEAKQFYINKQGVFSDIIKKHKEDIDNYLFWNKLHNK